MSVFQDRVAERAAALSLNDHSAALKAGLGPSYVRDILRGKLKNPSAVKLRALAAALECSTEYLIGASSERGEAAPDLDTPAARLRAARKRVGHRSAAAAAKAFGWEVPTYRHHENGTAGYDAEQAKRYAGAFGVDPAYLMFGTGASEPISRAVSGPGFTLRTTTPGRAVISLTEVEVPMAIAVQIATLIASQGDQ